MLRKIAILAAASAALAVAPAASAADRDSRIGVGVSLETFNFARFGAAVTGAVPPNAPVSLYVPIQIAPHLRIEPSIGFATFSQNINYADQNGLDSSGYTWNIGAGILYYPVVPQPAGFYLGGRLGLVFSGFSIPNPPAPSNDVTETDFYLTGVLGGEYFIAPKLSVGLEAQIGVTFFGDPDFSIAPPPGTVLNRDLVSFSTAGLIFLRYFF